MNSKQLEMERLNLSTIGKKTAISDKWEGDVPALVVRRNGTESYVIARWDEKTGKPMVTFDPEGNNGMIKNIKCLFTGFKYKNPVGKDE